MNKKITALLIFVTMLVLMTACSAPSQEYTTGEVLLSESFDEASAWETYVESGIDFQVDDGAYRVQTGDDGYIWGLNDEVHTDVVIEVTSTQASDFDNNAYGVICRSDISNNGDGYYFMISGDGYYTISKGEGEDVNELIEWTSSSAINEGQADNTIRAVCIGNYLALYVNDKFLGEVEDNEFTSGFAGFAAAASTGGTTDIRFDNLTITSASFAGE